MPGWPGQRRAPPGQRSNVRRVLQPIIKSLLPNSLGIETTTAGTDAVLAAATALCIVFLSRETPSTPLRAVWLTALGGWGLSALLGAITHGMSLDPGFERLLWQPLYLALGLAQALLVVAAVGAWRGFPAARRLLPFMVLAAALFYWATRRTGGNFLVFVIFSTATTVFALGVYLVLALRRTAGARLTAAGLALSLAAGAVQASTMSVHFIWTFDHNGLFHLVQLLGLGTLVAGLRRSLSA